MRKINAGVYPPETDLNDLAARLEYIATYFDGEHSAHGAEYAATIREAIAELAVANISEDFLSDFADVPLSA